MKPMCEKVLPSSNCSWRFVKYTMPNIDFNWHYHPEYEICLTLNSKGIRYVGDNIASYREADLVLVGPNLPHTWHSKKNLDKTEQIVYVAQIPLKWMDSIIDDNVELNILKEMFKLSFGKDHCSRCDRDGHIAVECYAKTYVNGNKIV